MYIFQKQVIFFTLWGKDYLFFKFSETDYVFGGHLLCCRLIFPHSLRHGVFVVRSFWWSNLPSIFFFAVFGFV